MCFTFWNFNILEQNVCLSYPFVPAKSYANDYRWSLGKIDLRVKAEQNDNSCCKLFIQRNE